MPTSINITIDNIKLSASLNDTPTAREVIDQLPIKGSGQRWGDEIYFSTSVQADLEPEARDVLEPGELAFWPPGNAICIFWGPTPASTGGECRAASDVNVIGRIEGDLSVLDKAQSGCPVLIERD